MTAAATPHAPTETVEAFRERARAYIAKYLPRLAPGTNPGGSGTLTDEEEVARVERALRLQRVLFDGGLAGVCVPREYGGLGLTTDHLAALISELAGYDHPADIQSPTFTPCMAVLLDFGTEQQKLEHVPPILRGDALWVQLLSEPSGGSDVAGAQMTAVRDGDEWVLNGSKIWTTGPDWSQWGLCLARTNWDVPKHRGLTVFMLPLHQPGGEIHTIEMLNGQRTFSQVFLSDVRVPDAHRLGDVDEGWTVGVRWMYHERTVIGGSPYVTRPAGVHSTFGPSGGTAGILARARSIGHGDDARTRELIGESRALDLVGAALTRRVSNGIRSGRTTDQAAAISRLNLGTSAVRQATIEYELMGARSIAWTADRADLGNAGIGYLMRQAACIGGGTTEMARNVISERVLGLPREASADRDRPYRDVPRSAGAR